jgi:hypothetical protein
MPKSCIDKLLFSRPKVRASVETLAADPGCSIDRLREQLHCSGIPASRSATARWMLRLRRQETGGRATLLGAVIRRVIDMNDRELAALARGLRRGKGTR